MPPVRFAWDEAKNRANRAKHAVSFEEARSPFFDDSALLIDDPGHSEDEERFLILGMSVRLRLLVVSHCYRRDDEEIRIISARKATARVYRNYEDRKR